MNKSVKHYINVIINDLLLKPFRLRLSYRTGSNPTDDIKRLLKNHMVHHIVDGGAYIGTFSLDIAEVFPLATVYAFEPSHQSYELLVKNTAANHRIKPSRFALGAEPGKHIFYTNASPLTNSLSKTSIETLKYFQGFNDLQGQDEAEVITLQEFLAKEQVHCVDLMKLDLQGHELQAIKGLGGMLNSIKLVYIEIEFLRIYENTPLFSEVESFLREKGFFFYQFYGLVRSPDDGRLLYGDAIFLNSNFITL
jgi:FkbM family methyltransferase